MEEQEFSPSRNGGETSAATAQEPRHTPGPWFVSADRERRSVLAEGYAVALVGNMGCDTGYPERERRPYVLQAQANARLIAAAPDLLEALVDAGATLNAGQWPRTAARIAAAIAKATGQEVTEDRDGASRSVHEGPAPGGQNV